MTFVVCPECKKDVRKRDLRPIDGRDVCCKCWRTIHRDKLKEFMPPIARERKNKLKIISPHEAEKEGIIKKRLSKMRVPIKKVEEGILWSKLKKDGKNSWEIKERIENLKSACLDNHEKAMQEMRQ